MGLSGESLQSDTINCTMTKYPARIPQCYDNISSAGNVYLLIFNGLSAGKGFAHQAVLIDVSGGSIDDALCGVTMHLTADSSDGQTSFAIDDRTWDKRALHDVILLGKLQPPQSSPFTWAIQLFVMVKT